MNNPRAAPEAQEPEQLQDAEQQHAGVVNVNDLSLEFADLMNL